MAPKPFKIQLVETFVTLMTAAFGMIAALAWNAAITAVIGQYFEPDNTAVPLLVYAIIITIVAVICIVIVARTLGKLKESMDAKEAAKYEQK
jgi:membrane protein YdbS with pleckstrin-like domain